MIELRLAPAHRISRIVAGASIALLGFSLAGCAATGTTVPTAPASPPATTIAPAPDSTATDSSATALERNVTIEVTGSGTEALVKTLVITAGNHNNNENDENDENDGEMVRQTLPFTENFTLPSETPFSKILVLGKYQGGVTGEISCTITIDGVAVSTGTSTGHKPAKCLFVEGE